MTGTAAPASRLLKSWGDEGVVYDVASGDTHYLKPLTLALYRLCLDHPGYSATELAAALAPRIGVPETEALRDLTEDTLLSLRSIGLLASA